MEIISKDVTIPIQDFKVKIHSSTLVSPIQKTPRKCIFLSNLDQRFNFHIPILSFFSANPGFPLETHVVERLKIALQKVLVPYDFAAGRVRLNPESGRLEIDCNAAGVGFVVASSEFSLDENIGDLVYTHPGYTQLGAQKLDNLGSDYNDQPLIIFQVTSFKCGGFSICYSRNHLLFDGKGAITFLQNVASQAFDDKPLDVIPCNNRHLLAARSPPRVEFHHREWQLRPSSESAPISPLQEEFSYTIFILSSTQIDYLKDKAKHSSTDTKPIKITRFNVVAALIWRCEALSVKNDSNKDRVSSLFCAVDVRSRMNPPLPPSYCGNGALNSYTSLKCNELEEGPFSKIVGVVSDGIVSVTDEYVRSALDWIEINKGVPKSDFTITSWWRLRYDEVVYPWGKPIYNLPVMSKPRRMCCLLSPDHLNENGVNVMVSLPAKEMDKFQSLLYDFFKT